MSEGNAEALSVNVHLRSAYIVANGSGRKGCKASRAQGGPQTPAVDVFWAFGWIEGADLERQDTGGDFYEEDSWRDPLVTQCQSPVRLSNVVVAHLEPVRRNLDLLSEASEADQHPDIARIASSLDWVLLGTAAVRDGSSSKPHQRDKTQIKIEETHQTTLDYCFAQGRRHRAELGEYVHGKGIKLPRGCHTTETNLWLQLTACRDPHTPIVQGKNGTRHTTIDFSRLCVGVELRRLVPAAAAAVVEVNVNLIYSDDDPAYTSLSHPDVLSIFYAAKGEALQLFGAAAPASESPMPFQRRREEVQEREKLTFGSAESPPGLPLPVLARCRRLLIDSLPTSIRLATARGGKDELQASLPFSEKQASTSTSQKSVSSDLPLEAGGTGSIEGAFGWNWGDLWGSSGSENETDTDIITASDGEGAIDNDWEKERGSGSTDEGEGKWEGRELSEGIVYPRKRRDRSSRQRRLTRKRQQRLGERMGVLLLHAVVRFCGFGCVFSILLTLILRPFFHRLGPLDGFRSHGLYELVRALQQLPRAVTLLSHSAVFAQIGSVDTDYETQKNESATGVKVKDLTAEGQVPLLYSVVLLRMVDWILGVIVAQWLISNVKLAVFFLQQIFQMLNRNLLGALINWLLGVPAGLKLNHAFSQLLLGIAETVMTIWIEFLSYFDFLLEPAIFVIAFLSFFGVSVFLGFAIDLISLFTIHVFHTHTFFTQFNRIFLFAWKSLFNLFRSRSYNVLRKKTESSDFAPDQLLVGSVVFTALSLLIPTFLTCHAVLLLVWMLVVATQKVLLSLLAFLHTAPLGLFAFSATAFPARVHLTLLSPQHTSRVRFASFKLSCTHHDWHQSFKAVLAKGIACEANITASSWARIFKGCAAFQTVHLYNSAPTVAEVRRLIASGKSGSDNLDASHYSTPEDSPSTTDTDGRRTGIRLSLFTEQPPLDLQNYPPATFAQAYRLLRLTLSPPLKPLNGS